MPYADVNTIISGLRRGILLEDTDELLPWFSHWNTLRSVGAPILLDENIKYPALRWEDRTCFGGLNCSLMWQRGITAGTQFFTSVRVYLQTRDAHNHSEALDEFHDSVRLLQSIFGRPDTVDEALVIPGPDMGGHVEWRFPRFVVTHTLSTPWGGFSNATYVEVRQSFLRRLMLHVKVLC